MRRTPLFLFVLFFAIPIILTACGNSDNAGEEPPPGSVPDNPFQTGPVKVTSLYPVDISGRSFADQLLLTVLQGVVAKYSTTQIFQYETSSDGYHPNDADAAQGLTTAALKLLHYLTHDRQPPLPVVSNPKSDTWEIVEDFKQYIKGFVVYAPQTNLQNLAVTLCGLSDLIPVTQDAVQTALAHGLTQKDDFRVPTYPHKTDQFIYQNIANLNKRFAVILSPRIPNGPQDYAVMLKGMIFWNGPYDINDPGSLWIPYAMNLLRLETAVPIFDYGVDEVSGVADVGFEGGFVVEATFMHNLSLLSSLGTQPEMARNVEPLKHECGRKYVTFIVSDGDNLQLLSNQLNNKIYYGSNLRGSFPIGWTIAPALYYLAPDIWNFYIQNATSNDEFVIGPSTIGYAMEEVLRINDGWNKQLSYLRSFRYASEIRTLLAFIHEDGTATSGHFVDGILDQDLYGLFYHEVGVDNAGHWGYGSGGFPINTFFSWLTPSSTLWSQADTLVSIINNDLPGSRYFHDGFYQIYAVRNFSDNPGPNNENNDLVGALARVYAGLDHSKVSVVTPYQFVDLQMQAKEAVPMTDDEHFTVTIYPRPPVWPRTSVKITATVPPGTTVDWYTGEDPCGQTYLGSGTSITVAVLLSEVKVYARPRNLTSGCSAWDCAAITITVI